MRAEQQADRCVRELREGVTGVNSDVIILLRADQRTHSVSILSIPRDLVMNNVRPGQFYKIDAALADGPGQLVAAVEENFGIPINHFVELNFDSFQNIVNALGGIKMYFPYRVRDDSSGLHIRTTGCVYLNGFNALALVRARNYWYFKDGQWIDDGSGDLGRIIRVHEFLRVLATAVSQRGLSNPLTDNSLLGAVAPDLEVDSRLSLGDMVDLLRAFHSTKIATVPELTMPNMENFADYIYEGYDYGSVVLPTYPQDQQAIDEFLGLKTPPGSVVAPGSFTVSVMDGTGTAGQATTTAGQLRRSDSTSWARAARHRSARYRRPSSTTARAISLVPNGSRRISTASSPWPRERPTPGQTSRWSRARTTQYWSSPRPPRARRQPRCRGRRQALSDHPARRFSPFLRTTRGPVPPGEEVAV